MKHYTTNQIRLNLDALIKEKGLSRTGVAKKLNISQANFSKMMNGSVVITLPLFAEKLPEVLGIDLIDIITHHLKKEKDDKKQKTIDKITQLITNL